MKKFTAQWWSSITAFQFGWEEKIGKTIHYSGYCIIADEEDASHAAVFNSLVTEW